MNYTIKMMLLCVGIMLHNFYAGAQACTQASLLQTAGIWKESLPGSISGIAAPDLTKEKKQVNALHDMIKLKYKPMGVVADFGGAYNRPYPNMAGNSYYYRIIPLNYHCEGASVKTDHETSTYFQVAVNMFDAEIYDSARGDRLLAEGFNVMPDMPVAKDGYWYFKETAATLGFGLSGKKLAILVTYDGKLPYAYVSRKEFLQKRKQILATEMETTAAGYKDALKSLELEKVLMEKTYKDDPEKLNKYLKKDYPYGKDKFEKLLAANANTYRPAFESMDKQLTAPDADLDQPAIVKKDPKARIDSYIFTSDDDPFGKVLIKPNPGYFNKELPRSTAQFILVSVTWNHNEPIASKFTEDILKAVDYAALKNMIGK
jgi:hypothetical protein